MRNCAPGLAEDSVDYAQCSDKFPHHRQQYHRGGVRYGDAGQSTFSDQIGKKRAPTRYVGTLDMPPGTLGAAACLSCSLYWQRTAAPSGAPDNIRARTRFRSNLELPGEHKRRWCRESSPKCGQSRAMPHFARGTSSGPGQSDAPDLQRLSSRPGPGDSSLEGIAPSVFHRES